MVSRRRLGSPVIAAFLAIAAQGAFASSALGHDSGLPTAATVLTRPAGAAVDARHLVALPGHAELGEFFLDQSAHPLKDPMTPMVCRSKRGC